MDIKELEKIRYFSVKNDLRISCIKKCSNFKNNDLNEEEKECLNDCSQKINIYLRISSDFYSNH